MLRKDLIQKSPVVQILGSEYLDQGRFGTVISRAGVGKTQFLVQIAISWLLEGKKVIHISLDDPIDKINLRYKEGYNNLIDNVGYIDPQKATRLWEDLAPCKFGITCQENTFSPQNIRDYLVSLKKNGLDMPSMIVVDGLDFDRDCSAVLNKLSELAGEFSLALWFSMKSHREEAFTDKGFPVQLDKVKELFEKAIYLQPKEDKIEVVILKDGAKVNERHLIDPATMMIA
ncbi:MAG: hypothetical protein HQK62_02830 [Desulfamplus sp.]|nr:hypothetical protein [Desulfamplus sp.]MBF0257766.1 hypothetical protein [Desulfamplus sp.]